jgi:hypothetical protein
MVVVIACNERKKHVSTYNAHNAPGWPCAGRRPESIAKQGGFNCEQSQVEQGVAGRGVSGGPALFVRTGYQRAARASG